MEVDERTWGMPNPQRAIPKKITSSRVKSRNRSQARVRADPACDHEPRNTGGREMLWMIIVQAQEKTRTKAVVWYSSLKSLVL